jgi:hypothetical protein
MTGRQQANLLGILFWVFTAFNILIVVAIAVIYIAIFGFVFSQVPQKPGDPDPAIMMTILIAIFAFAVIFSVLFSIPKMVAGYGLRKEKPWARTWAIVASIMAAMSFPIGTAIGVYGLVFLFGDEGKKYFESPEYGRLDPSRQQPTPIAPAPNSWQ